MKSYIIFLIIAIAFGVYMIIKSKATGQTISNYLKEGALVLDVRSK